MLQIDQEQGILPGGKSTMLFGRSAFKRLFVEISCLFNIKMAGLRGVVPDDGIVVHQAIVLVGRIVADQFFRLQRNTMLKTIDEIEFGEKACIGFLQVFVGFLIVAQLGKHNAQ